MSGIVPGLCRDCLAEVDDVAAACPRCLSRRIIRHPELGSLTLAHIDCDAFYATVEKRDDPSLADKPVIVGGSKRGVVLTCCYIARRFGVRSAMPMYRALQLCPHAAVVRPDMAKYSTVSRQVREIFRTVTPVVEPMSLDEAFLDMAGTENVHKSSAARTLADVARRVEREVGVTVSIGLSFNKLLAKLASDMDKPRGFGVIGRAEARGFLAGRRVGVLPGVGPKLSARLAEDGIALIGDLQKLGERELVRRYGERGRQFWRMSQGLDGRVVVADRDARGLSAETTFAQDLSAFADLDRRLWPLAQKVSARLKDADLAGRSVVLKLKTASFRTLSRHRTLGDPTQLAEVIYQAARHLLARETDGRRFRLIGVGVSDLCPGREADPPGLLDRAKAPPAALERAMDKINERFGTGAVRKGRGL